MQLNFNAYSKYYDLFYRDKDYFSETKYVSEKLGRLSPDAKEILELGSGTGKHAQLLCAEGFIVHGVEKSAEMIAASERLNVNGFTCTQGDITSFNLNKKFDAAISLFHVISYLTDTRDLILAFHNINRHLNVGGIFVFDVWYSPAVYTEKPEKRIKKIVDGNFTVIRVATPQIDVNRNQVDVHYSIIVENTDTGKREKIEEIHKMRHFSGPEIELAALSSGFDLLEAEEFLTGHAPGTHTWGVCFTLRKNR